MSDSADARQSPPSAHKFLFGDDPGCWGLTSKVSKLVERTRNLERVQFTYESTIDFIDYAILLAAERYAAGVLRAGDKPGDFGAYLDAHTGEWRSIPDPVEYLSRIARDRSTTVRRRRGRELARQASGREHELSADAAASVDSRESERLVEEFHAHPANSDCAQLHRLHNLEGLTYEAILPILGPRLGLNSVSSVRGRVMDCKRRLREFIETRYPGEASYWAER